MPPRHNTPVVLNVAEKPSVARALQQVFGRMPGAQSRGMRSEPGNIQVFTHENVQFPHIQSQGQGQMVNGPMAGHTMITTSVRGHLASTEFDASVYGWNKCEPIVLFDAPITTLYKDDMKPLEQMLLRQSRQVTFLILWLDCDREGEAIGNEVREVCQRGNPRLTDQMIFRARFSTVLAPEIQRALKTLGRLQTTLVDAVQLRSELDLRVGAAFTRFQTLRLQRQFECDSGGVISYGSCQFPTLGFVVERWATIQTFLPQDFWTIELSLVAPALDVENIQDRNSEQPQQRRSNYNNNTRSRPIWFTWKRGRLYDQLLATILYETCVDDGVAVVTSLTGRPKNKWRPVPLATVELQKRASKFLRIGAETVMKAAEELYQQGYISYPRTETEKFRPEFQHQPLFQQFASLGDACAEFSGYAQKLLSGSFQNPRAGQHDDQAHPPITPAKAVDPNTIHDQTQRNIYCLVVKHYLACCSRDAVGRETTLTVRIADEEFNATGLMVLEHNWLEIYQPWERWSTGQGELPALDIGSRITPHSLTLKPGQTTPPLFLSEVELISLMDRNGIGTDATISQHIATIQERSYAVKDAQQKFSPTPLGIALVQGYNSMGYQLNKPDLRREMEAECNHVAAGRKTKQEVYVPLLNKMKQTYQTALAEAQKLDDAMAQHFSRFGTNNASMQVVQAHFSLCGRCNNLMALKQQRGDGGGRNNNNNELRRKLLFCQTCQAGLGMPERGILHPHTTNDAPTKCPICNYQVVEIQAGDGYDGNGYKVCPKCFNDPPAEHGGGTGRFRCFDCQNATCPLSNPTSASEPAFSCPFCSTGQVRLRKNSRGFVLSCNRYVSDRCSYTIWLPKETQIASVVSGGDENQNSVCSRCSNGPNLVRLIRFEWKTGSLPPHWGRDHTTCVLCDTDFRTELGFSLPQPGQVQARPATGRGRGRSSAGRNAGGRGLGGRTANNSPRRHGGAGSGDGRNDNGENIICYRCGQHGHFATSCSVVSGGGQGSGGVRGNGGGTTCYKCHQSGHFANACPNR